MATPTTSTTCRRYHGDGRWHAERFGRHFHLAQRGTRARPTLGVAFLHEASAVARVRVLRLARSRVLHQHEGDPGLVGHAANRPHRSGDPRIRARPRQEGMNTSRVHHRCLRRLSTLRRVTHRHDDLAHPIRCRLLPTRDRWEAGRRVLSAMTHQTTVFAPSLR